MTMNKKPNLASLLCALMTLLFTPSAHAADQKFLDYIAGSYILIGKQGTTDKAYTGTVDLIIDGSTINVVRTINGTKTNGTATIEDTGKDRILIVLYEGRGDATMVGRYHIFTDPHSHGIMSGYLLNNPQQDGGNWLESLFYKKADVDCEG